MNNLLLEILQWMQNNNYRRASYDRLVGIIPSAATYDQLDSLVEDNQNILRKANIKGGLPGLAVLDDVVISEVIGNLLAPPPAVGAAAKVTDGEIEQNIRSEYYIVPGDVLDLTHSPLNQLTLCILVLTNGYTVVGKSACVDSALFDPDIGRRIARQDAVRQVWPLLGFRLADQLSHR